MDIWCVYMYKGCVQGYNMMGVRRTSKLKTKNAAASRQSPACTPNDRLGFDRSTVEDPVIPAIFTAPRPAPRTIARISKAVAALAFKPPFIEPLCFCAFCALCALLCVVVKSSRDSPPQLLHASHESIEMGASVVI